MTGTFDPTRITAIAMTEALTLASSPPPVAEATQTQPPSDSYASANTGMEVLSPATQPLFRGNANSRLISDYRDFVVGVDRVVTEELVLDVGLLTLRSNKTRSVTLEFSAGTHPLEVAQRVSFFYRAIDPVLQNGFGIPAINIKFSGKLPEPFLTTENYRSLPLSEIEKRLEVNSGDLRALESMSIAIKRRDISASYALASYAHAIDPTRSFTFRIFSSINLNLAEKIMSKYAAERTPQQILQVCSAVMNHLENARTSAITRGIMEDDSDKTKEFYERAINFHYGYVYRKLPDVLIRSLHGQMPSPEYLRAFIEIAEAQLASASSQNVIKKLIFQICRDSTQLAKFYLNQEPELLAEALFFLRKAHGINPGNYMASAFLAKVLQQHEYISEAKEIIEKLFSADPLAAQNPFLIEQHAIILSRTGRSEEALRILHKLHEQLIAEYKEGKLGPKETNILDIIPGLLKIIEKVS